MYFHLFLVEGDTTVQNQSVFLAIFCAKIWIGKKTPHTASLKMTLALRVIIFLRASYVELMKKF